MRFPVEQLKIDNATFEATKGSLSMEIHLEPFEYYNGEATVSEKTSVILPDIDFGTKTATGLSGKSLVFPTNPTPGYIDGSIYIHHAHHPVDVTSIEFGEPTDGNTRAVIAASLVLSYEGLGDYEDTQWTFEVTIPNTELAQI